MIHMSAATFRVLRASANKKEQTNEANINPNLRAFMDSLKYGAGASESDNGFCNLLYRCKCQERRNKWNLDGLRRTIRRIKADLRSSPKDDEGMEHEVRSQATSNELTNRSHGYSDSDGCRPRTPITTGWNGY